MSDDVGNNYIGASADEIVASNAIITLAQARVYLKKNEKDVTQDVIIQQFINIASSQIEGYIGGVVAVQEFTDEILDGTGNETIYPKNAPIISLLTGVVPEVQYRENPTAEWLDLSSDVRYIIIKPTEPYKIVLYDNYFPKGVANIKISYKAGYNPILGDFQRVCLEMVAEMYKESMDGRIGISSKSNSVGGGSGSDSYKEMSERHEKILSRYRWRTI